MISQLYLKSKILTVNRSNFRRQDKVSLSKKDQNTEFFFSEHSCVAVEHVGFWKIVHNFLYTVQTREIQNSGFLTRFRPMQLSYTFLYTPKSAESQKLSNFFSGNRKTSFHRVRGRGIVLMGYCCSGLKVSIFSLSIRKQSPEKNSILRTFWYNAYFTAFNTIYLIRTTKKLVNHLEFSCL